jgi:PEGA domain
VIAMLSKPCFSAFRKRGLVALFAAALGLFAAVPAAHADDDEAEEDGDPRAEASERFRRGVDLYKDRDYVAALVEFKRAYELAPNYRVLYNLGQTSRELKDYASALVAYRQYIEEGGDEIRSARKKEVESALEDLIARVGTISISTNVEGAELQVDDVTVGTSPLDEAIVVNIGKRRIVATLSGYAPARRVIEVAGRDELMVDLELSDLSRDDPAPQPPSTLPPAADEGGANVAGIVALSVTGACGIVTGVLGGLALGASGDRDDALAAFPGNPKAIEDAKSKTSTLALATDVMIGVTAAGAVTTLILFLVDPGSDAEEEAESDDSANASDVSLSLAPSPVGLWLTGTF